MFNNMMGRHLAVVDNNQLSWQQLIGNANGTIFKWKNPTGHTIIIKDFYVKFTTNTGTATDKLVAFVGATEDVTTVPTGTLVAAIAVATNTQFVTGVKDIEVAPDAWVQVAMTATADGTTRVTAAAVSGVCGMRYAMEPRPDQIF